MDGTSEASATTEPGSPEALGQAQLRELYTGPPGEFVGRRKGLVTALRDSGDKAAARDAAALRKPSTPAWVLNLLAEDGRTAQELLELAGEITAAVAAGERTELRTLAAAQRLLVTDILERATELAAGSGTKIPAGAREVVEAAIRGVLTDPSTAQQLFTGVLVELPDPDDADALPELAFRSPSAPKPAAPATNAPKTKPAPSKTATPETATPKTGTPKTGTPKTGTPKTGTPKTGTPKTGTPKTGTPKTPPHGPARSSAKSAASAPAAEKLETERAAAAAAADERKRRHRAVQEAELVESRWDKSVRDLEQEQARLRAETTRIQRSLQQARTEQRRAERRADRFRRLLAELAD